MVLSKHFKTFFILLLFNLAMHHVFNLFKCVVFKNLVANKMQFNTT